MMSGESSTCLLPMTTFSEPFNPEKKLVHVRTGKKKRKQGEKKKTKRVRSAQLPSRSASLVNSMLPHAGDHTGSRAIEWLTEVDRRTHTCLIDASIYILYSLQSAVVRLDIRTVWREVGNNMV